MIQWIRKHAISISLLPVLAVMVMIFCFSSQTGEESGAMSGEITTQIVEMLVPDFEELPVQQQESIASSMGLVIRKAAHFSEFALLGFFLLLHILQIQKRVTVSFPWLWSWGVGTLYAVSDEFHQMFVGGRSPAVTDVLIDSCGVIAGTLFLLLILACLRRVKDK